MPPELSSPVYQHLLINHVPIIGLGFAVLALVLALLVRNVVAQRIALVLVLLASGSAWAVNWTGNRAFDVMHEQTDDAGSDWLDKHVERAESAAPAFYGLAGLSLTALLVPLRWPRSGPVLGWIVLVLGLGCLGAAGWIAKAGGQVRHAELRAAAEKPGHP
jgi:hypothetical protein